MNIFPGFFHEIIIVYRFVGLILSVGWMMVVGFWVFFGVSLRFICGLGGWGGLDGG